MGLCRGRKSQTVDLRPQMAEFRPRSAMAISQFPKPSGRQFRRPGSIRPETGSTDAAGRKKGAEAPFFGCLYFSAAQVSALLLGPGDGE